ncbi:hypothetical protein U1Q18_049900, partial [Sarracenia purpurea var. burkii]
IVSPSATDRRHHNLLVVKIALLLLLQFLLLVLCGSASRAVFPAGLGAVLLHYIWWFLQFWDLLRLDSLVEAVLDLIIGYGLFATASRLFSDVCAAGLLGLCWVCASVCLWRRGGCECAAGLMCLGCASSFLVVCCFYAIACLLQSVALQLGIVAACSSPAAVLDVGLLLFGLTKKVIHSSFYVSFFAVFSFVKCVPFSACVRAELVCCWFFSLLDGCVVLRSISCAVVLHPQFCCSNFAGSVFLVGWLSSSCCLCVRWLVGFLVQQFCRLFRYNNSSFAATDLLGPLCGVLVFSVWCCWMLQVLAAMSCAAAWLWCSSIVRNWWRSLLLHCLVLVASSRVLRSSFGRFPFLLSVAPLELQQL